MAGIRNNFLWILFQDSQKTDVYQAQIRHLKEVSQTE